MTKAETELEQDYLDAALGAIEWGKVPRDTADLKERFAQYDLIIGIVPDPSEARGFGVPILKGQNVLRDIIATRRTRPLTVGGVPCGSYEEAQAMMDVLGDGAGGGTH